MIVQLPGPERRIHDQKTIFLTLGLRHKSYPISIERFPHLEFSKLINPVKD
ncbi:hypothetical protein Mcup_0886 [Metallosphaera cuprina Ar-4]|uniref:Uncharacterized protein n=1 Tax=Metallosphaera cuprina (strain Ar-4) TaxID=1006006 RepID=F4G2E3_METCR|nr:hypothetical protein Mcup_0886 [Metallosphaera cuprina Ar-4]